MSGTHAVVIGGSLTGLCVGRVLSRSFDKVTVIEGDAYPSGLELRSGVPQSRHVHMLLARGRKELERLFPGFDQLMISRGAPVIDYEYDFATLRSYGWDRRERTDVELLYASRNLIESVVRELFRKLPNVTLLERTTATGLVVTQTGRRRATGVQIRSAGDVSSTIDGDLIVDAGGRRSKAFQWLKTIGITPPEETVVNAFTGYASRWYRAPDADRTPKDWWWKGIWIDAQEPDNRLGATLSPIENNQWIVTIAARGGHYPPTDEAGYLAALGKLRSPLIGEAVQLAEPLSPVYGYRDMANRLRHYESWQEQLDSFIAVGDSRCAFNPLYGQGMTSATLSALALEETLNSVDPFRPEFSNQFFRAQAAVQAVPWHLATGADLALPETEGKRPRGSELFQPLVMALVKAASEDLVVRRAFVRVMHLLEPPSVLMTPTVVGRTAIAAVRKLGTKLGVMSHT